MISTTDYNLWKSTLLKEPISFRHLKRFRFQQDVPVREAFHTSTTPRLGDVYIISLVKLLVNTEIVSIRLPVRHSSRYQALLGARRVFRLKLKYRLNVHSPLA